MPNLYEDEGTWTCYYFSSSDGKKQDLIGI